MHRKLSLACLAILCSVAAGTGRPAEAAGGARVVRRPRVIRPPRVPNVRVPRGPLSKFAAQSAHRIRQNEAKARQAAVARAKSGTPGTRAPAAGGAAGAATAGPGAPGAPISHLPWSSAKGRPEAQAEAKTGYRIWHDQDFVYVYPTYVGQQPVFIGGEIVAETGIVSEGETLGAKKPGAVWNDKPGHLKFRFRSDQGVEGVRFRVKDAQTLRCILRVRGTTQRVPVTIGAQALPVAANPLVFDLTK